MRQFRCNGLDIIEDNDFIRIISTRDGNIFSSKRSGKCCYEYRVKFPNR